MNRNLTVGSFVVAGLGLIASAMFLIGNQNKSFGRHIEYYTVLKDVSGLMKGAEVQVGGLDAGEVSDISVPASPSAGFRLTLRLAEKIRGLIRTDSVVTIETEGVVGDKFVLVHPGSPEAPEAAPDAVLPSKEPIELAELLEKSLNLLNNANNSMKVVTDKLGGTLDAVKVTVNNTNDLVVGVKEGRGAIGMLLRDEATADNIRQAVSNMNQATISLNRVLGQADSLMTDFRSRNLGEKTAQVLSTANDIAHNFDASSQMLRQTMVSALGPDTQGIDAGNNIQQSLSNLNLATGNMAEDTEALKHELFFKGFFKHRGYYSLVNLDPDRYRGDKRFVSPKNPRVWIETSQLFSQKPDGEEVLTSQGEKRLDAAMAKLGDDAVGEALVVEGYSSTGGPGEQLAVSRDRAVLIRNYLHSRFQLDLQQLGTVALRGVPPPATRKGSWDGACIVLLAPPKKRS